MHGFALSQYNVWKRCVDKLMYSLHRNHGVQEGQEVQEVQAHRECRRYRHVQGGPVKAKHKAQQGYKHI